MKGPALANFLDACSPMIFPDCRQLPNEMERKIVPILAREKQMTVSLTTKTDIS
jgi:hypothetical protein